MLVGFTLTNGVAAGNGGGVYCESTSAVLSNCVLSGNSACRTHMAMTGLWRRGVWRHAQQLHVTGNSAIDGPAAGHIGARSTTAR